MRTRLVQVRCDDSEAHEAYEVYDENSLASARLHLSKRWFTVEVISSDLRVIVIYSASPKGIGAFEDDERDYHLRFAVDAIEHWFRSGAGRTGAPAPNVSYDIVRLEDQA